jgi:endonuclease/exonuclease/phosphatase family metal-dependent hydrolase
MAEKILIRKSTRNFLLVAAVGLFAVAGVVIGCLVFGKASTDGAVLENNPTGLPEKLTIVTYNVLADANNTDKRLGPLLEVIESANADIIVMQECTGFFISALRKTGWSKQYTFIPEDMDATATGGLLILSRFPVIKTHFKFLKSRQDRGALVIKCRAGKSEFSVATIHLDSYLEDGPIRAIQLEQVFAMLGNTGDAVLAGDFNFGDNEQPETDALDSAYADCWKKLRPSEPGYTWNMEKSELARANSFPKERSRRIDRVLVRSVQWQPAEIRIIGTSRIAPMVFPSDHFGLCATLKRRADRD